MALQYIKYLLIFFGFITLFFVSLRSRSKRIIFAYVLISIALHFVIKFLFDKYTFHPYYVRPYPSEYGLFYGTAILCIIGSCYLVFSKRKLWIRSLILTTYCIATFVLVPPIYYKFHHKDLIRGRMTHIENQEKIFDNLSLLVKINSHAIVTSDEVKSVGIIPSPDPNDPPFGQMCIELVFKQLVEGSVYSFHLDLIKDGMSLTIREDLTEDYKYPAFQLTTTGVYNFEISPEKSRNVDMRFYADTSVVFIRTKDSYQIRSVVPNEKFRYHTDAYGDHSYNLLTNSLNH